MPSAAYANPLDDYLIPGGYQETRSARSRVFTYQYTGDTSTLIAACPGGTDWPYPGQAWGDTPGFITTVTPVILGKSGHSLVTVVVEDAFLDGETIGTGTHTETSFEMESATVWRPLLEHPDFNTDGSNPLTFADHVDIGFWRAEPTYALRSAYKYADASGTRTLSTNAQRAARYFARGVEQYPDEAPIARRTKKYVGGPPPSSADAGLKTSFFSSFPGGNPDTDLEWINTGERGLRAAGSRDWFQTSELTGATKVLIDRKHLYLT